ncbi:uncharacterized protein LOC110170138 isoform X2 [Boleophthalmus pectinirostris]|uniref:uncharacterized protein LOC110170138 isoform X2 n=1 Tax=Boleophthalmus pectinirostris TaxID=150288 RepID=UPI00242C218F|nr:uncharacterized protein LOC110170138 isoform X2 [Boleophthalmus pectinirostris]
MQREEEAQLLIKMDAELRPRQFFFLHLWCGALSVAVIVMATMLITTKPPSAPPSPTPAPTTTTANQNTTSREKNFPVIQGPPGPPAFNSSVPPSTAPSLSYIQLIPDRNSWKLDNDLSADLACDACSLVYNNNSIHCRRKGLYLAYAQVKFHSDEQNWSFTLKKNGFKGETTERTLFQIDGPKLQNSSFAMKVVSLQKEDSISLIIDGKYSYEKTFWGVIQLQHIGR